MVTGLNQRWFFLVLVSLTSAWPHYAWSQTSSVKAESDHLGMTCAQILKMSSTEWIAYFDGKVKTSGTGASPVARASTVYGKCYDARTDSLVASLVKRGRAPSKAAREDFGEFEAALKDFSAKALIDAPPSAGSEKQLLAALYQKQFRYEFYQQYQPKIVQSPTSAKPTEEAKSTVPLKSSATSPSAPSNGSARSSSAEDTDEMTKAKNRFGELLGALPDDKLHELHAAFGEVIGLHALGNEMRLAVYRYAIFLLEPSTAKTSYPPPF